MNDSHRETRCACLSRVPEVLLEANDGIERKISHTLEDAQQLMRNVQTGRIDSIPAANAAQEISNSAKSLHEALKYLDERLKLVEHLMSEIEYTLMEPN
jgi:hypothetical protein